MKAGGPQLGIPRGLSDVTDPLTCTHSLSALWRNNQGQGLGERKAFFIGCESVMSEMHRLQDTDLCAASWKQPL